MEICFKEMSVGCTGTALELNHNLPAVWGLAVWHVLKTPSLWTSKVISPALILLWAQQIGVHQVSADSNDLILIILTKASSHFTQALETSLYSSNSALPPTEGLYLHWNLGLATKGGFVLPKAFPSDSRQQEKGLDPQCDSFFCSLLYLLLLGWFLSSLFCVALLVWGLKFSLPLEKYSRRLLQMDLSTLKVGWHAGPCAVCIL